MLFLDSETWANILSLKMDADKSFWLKFVQMFLEALISIMKLLSFHSL